MRGVRVGFHYAERSIADGEVIRLVSLAVVVSAGHGGVVWNTPLAVQATNGRWTPIIDVTRLLEAVVMCIRAWAIGRRVW